MTRAVAIFRHPPSEERFALGPGDLIGRSDGAAMCLDDPRISEAHAMVSLRDRALKLLALRGRFRLDGTILHEVELKAGLNLELAPALQLVCEEVRMPSTLLGVRIEGVGEVALTGTLTLRRVHGQATVKRGVALDGLMTFWSVGDRWRARCGEQGARALEAGDQFECDGLSVEVFEVTLQDASKPRTRSALQAPMTLRRERDRVVIERARQAPLIVSGIPSKILSALLKRGGTSTWQEIIEEVWPGDLSAQSALRRRFDAGLRRLRDTLAHVSPRGEALITLDGAGVVALNLGREDRVEHDDER